MVLMKDRSRTAGLVAAFAAAILLVALGPFPAHGQDPTLAFQPMVDWEFSGSQPQRIIADDFNLDGNLDVAISSSVSGEVSILMSDGMGSFVDSKTLHTMIASWGLDSGEFDGDPIPDLAVTSGIGGDHAVRIYLGVGDGTFTLHTTLAAGNFPLAVVADDYDEDGTTDLAVANNVGGGLTVFLGLGGGDFGAGVHYGSGSSATDMVKADFDRDGHTDLAMSHYGGVDVYAGSGDGTFARTAGAGINSITEAVSAGDLNDDGWPDVASGTIYGGEVIVRFNNQAGGFAPGPTLLPGSFLQDVVIDDLNRDGHGDIIAVHDDGNRVVIYLGTGGGAFLAGQPFATNLEPQAVLAADLDEDGWNDLSVPCRMYGDTPMLSVLTQIPQGPVLDILPDPLLAGMTGTFTVTNAGPDTPTWLAYSLVGPGSTPVPPLGITLDLANPAQAGSMMMSDGSGNAAWAIPIPPAGVGRSVWLQACQAGVTTNVATTTIE